MVQNIDDVLQRGAILSELENKSANLTGNISTIIQKALFI